MSDEDNKNQKKGEKTKQNEIKKKQKNTQKNPDNFNVLHEF